jgi:hypothetical protein
MLNHVCASIITIQISSPVWCGLDKVKITFTICYILHDLETFLCNKYNGLPYLKEQINDLLHDDQTENYLNWFVLLYADDKIILSETKQELQRAINGMEEYWK